MNLLLRYFPAFLRCKCNPIGSSSIACHPITGQCVCRAGVEGRLCSSCRVGFFGFSSRGCRGAGLYFKHLHCTMYRPLIHLLIQITLEAISNSSNVCLCSPPCPPMVPSRRPPLPLLSQPVTVTRWAPSPCSVTVTAPATVARASWAISVTNVS